MLDKYQLLDYHRLRPTEALLRNKLEHRAKNDRAISLDMSDTKQVSKQDSDRRETKLVTPVIQEHKF